MTANTDKIADFTLRNFSEILIGKDILVSGTVKNNFLVPDMDCKSERYPEICIDGDDALALLMSLNAGGPDVDLKGYNLTANHYHSGHRIGEGDRHFEVRISNDSNGGCVPHVEVGINRNIGGYGHMEKTQRFCYAQDQLGLTLHRARELAFLAIDYYLTYKDQRFLPAEKLLGT